MAVFAGSEKLENRTMAQSSDFIIGKNRFEYRDKQKRLMVLVWNLWSKKKEVWRQQFKPERNAFLLKVLLIITPTIEILLEKIVLKLLISIDVKNDCNVLINDRRNVKFCNLQTYTNPEDENNDSFFRITLHM